MKYQPHLSNYFSHRGWTLVELLVAMTLALLLVAGIGQIYLAAKRSYDIQTNLAQIQDVGRYVTAVLTHDIRMAGNWGIMDISKANETPADDPPVSPPDDDPTFLTGDITTADACLSGADENWGKMITRRVFGLNDTDSGYGCIGSDRLQGDILTIRYANPVETRVIEKDEDDNYDNSLYLHTAPLRGGLIAFDDGGAIVPGLEDYVTSVTEADDVADDTDLLSSFHKVIAHSYYVATPIATECGDVPVLARKVLNANRVPEKESLVNGVEMLQFQYGVDTAITAAIPQGDRAVNQYFDANNVTNWNQVRAVRFWALVRSNCPESGYTNNTTYRLGNLNYTVNDNFRRAVYTSTVMLRNIKTDP